MPTVQPVTLHRPPPIVRRYQYPILVCSEGEMPELTQQLRKEYERMYITLKVPSAKIGKVDSQIDTIVANKDKYDYVSDHTGVPWFVVGVIHMMECNADFNCHLHNGDPLTRRTKNVPAGRPEAGIPPFSWEESAVDALRYSKFNEWEDWDSIGGILYKLETYNGWGYRAHNTPTPYLWGGTYFYLHGKYIKDGVWSSKAVSSQIGAAVLIHRMVTRGILPSVVLRFSSVKK